MAADEICKWTTAPCSVFSAGSGEGAVKTKPRCSLLYYEAMACADDLDFKRAADNIFGGSKYLVLQSSPGRYSMCRAPEKHRLVDERIRLLAKRGYRYLEEETETAKCVVGRASPFRTTGMILIKDKL